MNIYPYVYIVTHNETGEFYIGYREANTVPASQDFLSKYKTSSKQVKPRISEFTGQIIAEFFTKEAAYDFEQNLISEHFNNPLCLNKFCHVGHKRFRCTKHTEESKAKMSLLKRGKKKQPYSDEALKNISQCRIGKKHTPETKAKMSQTRKGRPGKPMSASARAKMSVSRKNKKWMFNIETNQTCLVSLEDIPKYISNNWILGRTNCSKS